MPRVMIAEDDPIMAGMLEETLVANGYDVCGTAGTVEKAVELGERYKPDLAVLDIRLADGGLGTEIPARLKSRGHMGVLYASGHAGQMALTSGDGEALIVKPYRSDDVIRGLRIVEQIISSRNASRDLPKGFSILNGVPDAGIVPNFTDADLADQNQRLCRQQSEIARFSAFAVVCRDLDRVLSEAARVCAECMRVPYCAIYRYRPEEDDLLIAAGFGWDHGTIGRASSRVDGSTPHGRAFTSGEPVICDRLSPDAGLVRPRLYIAHGIVTTLSVLIISNYQPSGSHYGAVENLPYGVLEIASTAQRDYDDHDIEFLSSIANIAAAAVDTMKRDIALRVATDRLQDVIKDQRTFNNTEILSPDEKVQLANDPRLRRAEIADVNPLTIAIVDDDAAVRDSLRFLLEIIGYSVETFASAAEFLKTDIQHLACLFLDYQMPEMSGMELAERLRADGSGIPILLITGSASPAIVARAAELGVTRVLEKPPSEEDLLDFISATRPG